MDDLYIGSVDRMPEPLKQRWEKRLSAKKRRVRDRMLYNAASTAANEED